MIPEVDIGRQIDTLIEKLPRDAAGQMLDQIEGEAGSGPRKEAVRQALVKRLNASRSQHARRLFTGLFEPFLCRDPMLLRAELAPTGVIHPLDLGAIWAWLAGGPIRDMASQADARLKEMATDQPIDRALLTPEAVEMGMRLREAAATALTPTLDVPQDGQALLVRLNELRVKEAARTGGLPVPRPLGRDDLVLIRGLLVSAAEVRTLVDRTLDALSRRKDQGLEDLAEAAGALPAVPIGARSGQADIGRMVPLTLLNRHRAFGALPAFLSAAPTAWREMLATALTRHLARAAIGITEELTAIAVPDGGAAGVRGPLSATATRREALDRDLAAADELLVTAEEFGLLESQRHGPPIREQLGQMVRKVEAALYPALIDRCAAANRSLSKATPDHDTVEWLLAFAGRWRAVLTRDLHWGTGYTEFRDHVLEDLRDGIARCLTREGYEEARDRLAHVGRLSSLARQLGAGPEGWLSLLDQGLVQTATARLRDPTELTSGDIVLLTTVSRLIDAELKRTRYWKSPELQEFAELAAERLMSRAAE